MGEERGQGHRACIKNTPSNTNCAFVGNIGKVQSPMSMSFSYNYYPVSSEMRCWTFCLVPSPHMHYHKAFKALFKRHIVKNASQFKYCTGHTADPQLCVLYETGLLSLCLRSTLGRGLLPRRAPWEAGASLPWVPRSGTCALFPQLLTAQVTTPV